LIVNRLKKNLVRDGMSNPGSLTKVFYTCPCTAIDGIRKSRDPVQHIHRNAYKASGLHECHRETEAYTQIKQGPQTTPGSGLMRWYAIDILQYTKYIPGIHLKL
jgi:hypothetical protein